MNRFKMLTDGSVKQISVARETGLSKDRLSVLLRGWAVPRETEIRLLARWGGVLPAIVRQYFADEVRRRLQEMEKTG